MVQSFSDGDGDLDLIVAEFGWLNAGSIRLLENRTTVDERPLFITITVDPRHGTIHVPVTGPRGPDALIIRRNVGPP